MDFRICPSERCKKKKELESWERSPFYIVSGSVQINDKYFTPIGKCSYAKQNPHKVKRQYNVTNSCTH